MLFPVTIAIARCMWRRNQVDACIVETQCAGRSHGNIGEDGVEDTDIEVVVEMNGDIRDTVQLVKTLERPLTERK